MSVLIKGMDMPTMPETFKQAEKVPYIDVRIFADGTAVTSKGERPYYTQYSVIPVPPHGRLIVLPCKVGDTVYLIGSNPEYEARIIGLGVERSGNVWFEWAQYVENVDDPDELWDEGTFYIDDIGKTVFLNRKEKEKALKEAQE